jgi:opacity protein-like surface antigen
VRLARVVAALLAVGIAAARPAGAQTRGSFTERLGIDSLAFSGLGVQVGWVRPIHILPANSYTIVADYGELAAGWRVVFHATYWGSRFTDRMVRNFADSLKEVITDPSGDDIVRLGDITVSDISLAADIRHDVLPNRWLQPFVGGGFATHVVNADGRLIDGTFVERAVDQISVGLAAEVGVETRFLGNLAVNALARYDLLSLARYGSVRVGGTYYFDPPSRRPAPPARVTRSERR